MISRIVWSSTYFARLGHVLTDHNREQYKPQFSPLGNTSIQGADIRRIGAYANWLWTTLHGGKQQSTLQGKGVGYKSVIYSKEWYGLKGQTLFWSPQKRVLYYSYHYLRLPGPGEVHM